jgi:hypothetical protein
LAKKHKKRAKYTGDSGNDVANASLFVYMKFFAQANPPNESFQTKTGEFGVRVCKNPKFVSGCQTKTPFSAPILNPLDLFSHGLFEVIIQAKLAN